MDHGYRIWAGGTTTGEIDWILSLRFLECYYCMIARLKKKGVSNSEGVQLSNLDSR